MAVAHLLYELEIWSPLRSAHIPENGSSRGCPLIESDIELNNENQQVRWEISQQDSKFKTNDSSKSRL